MEQPNITTTIVTRQILKEALKNNTFWKDQPYIPFTKRKARWLLKNKRFEDNDVCAHMAFENGKLISYIFFIPDIIKTKGKKLKIFWMRRWWVDAKYENSVLPTYMMKEALSSIKNKVMLKFLGKKVEDFFRRQAYQEFSHRVRYFILFSADTDLLTSKIKPLKKVKFITDLIDNTSGNLIEAINKRKISSKIKDLNYEYLSELDDETWKFLKSNCKDDLVYKTKAYVNWQLDSSQYLVTTNKERNKQFCLIASASDKIYSTQLKILKDGQFIGFIAFQVRSSEFNIKYFCTEDAYYELCLDVLMDNFIKAKSKILHTEDERLAKSLINKFSIVYTDKRQLYSLAHKDLGVDFTEAYLKDQDGHFA